MYLAIGSKGTPECKGYRTAGEVLQAMSLESSILIQRRFIYLVQMLGFAFPRMISGRGQVITGTTQKLLFATLEKACALRTSGTYLQELYNTMNVVSNCVESCKEGDVKFRQRALDRCQSLLPPRPQGLSPDYSATEHLPHDVLRLIASYLTDPVDFVEFGKACRSTFLVSQDIVLWRNLCLAHFPADCVCC
jgi:hypothetical protein